MAEVLSFWNHPQVDFPPERFTGIIHWGLSASDLVRYTAHRRRSLTELSHYTYILTCSMHHAMLPAPGKVDPPAKIYLGAHSYSLRPLCTLDRGPKLVYL
uniref:Uncharacterized protein n=1 Tax=Cacopsylla melanoneura TaxID=428564 RepID=A0A8D9BZU9_9HEMI